MFWCNTTTTTFYRLWVQKYNINFFGATTDLKKTRKYFSDKYEIYEVCFDIFHVLEIKNGYNKEETNERKLFHLNKYREALNNKKHYFIELNKIRLNDETHKINKLLMEFDSSCNLEICELTNGYIKELTDNFQIENDKNEKNFSQEIKKCFLLKNDM